MEGNRAAFVDTGGVYLICSPEIADSLALSPDEGLAAPRMLFRGAYLAGMLHRVDLTIPATHGETLTVEATAFVPEQTTTDWQSFPCVLGLQGCLERLRFAVDPVNDTIFFGALEPQAE